MRTFRNIRSISSAVAASAKASPSTSSLSLSPSRVAASRASFAVSIRTPAAVRISARANPSHSLNLASEVRCLRTSSALDPSDSAADGSHSQPAISSPEGAKANDWNLLASSIGSAVQSAPGIEQVYVPLSHLHDSTQPSGLETQHISLSSYVFGQAPRRDVMHSAVVYYLDSQRSGTANTKTRSEVNFSGRKLRPQKGTGRARLGTRSNPLMKKGGVNHGPKPRGFATDLPRRVRELALRSALSARWSEGKLHVVPSLYWDAPPKVTGNLARTLRQRGWQDALFLSAPRDPQPAVKLGLRQRLGRPSACDPTYSEAVKDRHTVELQHFASALANIPNTELIRLDMLTEEAQKEAKRPENKKKPGELHAYEVLLRNNVVLDIGALEWLEEKLGGAIVHEDVELLRGLGSQSADASVDAGLAKLTPEDTTGQRSV